MQQPEFPLGDSRHPSGKPKSYEIRVQLLNETPDARKIVVPEDAVDYWRDTITKAPWYFPDREMAIALVLNTRYRILGHSLVSIGTLNESLVHPRETFRAAIAMNAYAIVFMHNPPSGDHQPSEADQRMTKRLSEAGQLLQIRMIDHVIIGDPGHYSFRESGLI